MVSNDAASSKKPLLMGCDFKVQKWNRRESARYRYNDAGVISFRNNRYFLRMLDNFFEIYDETKRFIFGRNFLGSITRFKLKSHATLKITSGKSLVLPKSSLQFFMSRKDLSLGIVPRFFAFLSFNVSRRIPVELSIPQQHRCLQNVSLLR